MGCRCSDQAVWGGLLDPNTRNPLFLLGYKKLPIIKAQSAD
jgi:hypothetical protein